MSGLAPEPATRRLARASRPLARVDAAIARELLRAIEPMAIEAAMEAERRYMAGQDEQQRIVELELQQARYEASLAERRYAACDPDNRLIAAQLEKSWEATLRRVEACQVRLEAAQTPKTQPPRRPTLPGWPTISMLHGTRQA
jgi:hypothetical protein